MYTLSMEEVTIIVGGKRVLLPKEVAEALGSDPSAVLAAFGEAAHRGVAKLAVNLYNGSLAFAGAEEPQWDWRYTRYTLRNDDLMGWSIYDHALGRCYGGRHLGNLPEFVQGKVPAQPGDYPAILEMAKGIKPFVSKREQRRLAAEAAAAAEVVEQVLYLDMDELDAALAARR